MVFVHPFDDPAVIAGQGTVAVEMLAEAPELDTLVIPIGGGGLISGCATVAKERGGIEVIGVQAELYPSMYNRIRGTHLATGGDTLAEGIAVKAPGALTSRIVEALVDDIVLISERTWRRRWRCCCRSRRRWWRGLAPPASPRCWRIRAVCGPQGRHRAVRRQYRHAPAGERAAARFARSAATSRGCASS